MVAKYYVNVKLAPRKLSLCLSYKLSGHLLCRICSFRNLISTTKQICDWTSGVWFNSFPLVTHICVNELVSIGMLSDDTKALSEPTLTYHQRCLMAFTWDCIHKNLIGNVCLEMTLFKFPPPTSEANGYLYFTGAIPCGPLCFASPR